MRGTEQDLSPAGTLYVEGEGELVYLRCDRAGMTDAWTLCSCDIVSPYCVEKVTYGGKN